MRCRVHYAAVPRTQNKNGELAHSNFLDVARGRNHAVAGNPRCIREIARLSPRTRRGGVTPAAHGNPRRVFLLLCAPPPQALYAYGGLRFCRRRAPHAFFAYMARRCAVVAAAFCRYCPHSIQLPRRARLALCAVAAASIVCRQRAALLPQTRCARSFRLQGTSICGGARRQRFAAIACTPFSYHVAHGLRHAPPPPQALCAYGGWRSAANASCTQFLRTRHVDVLCARQRRSPPLRSIQLLHSAWFALERDDSVCRHCPHAIPLPRRARLAPCVTTAASIVCHTAGNAFAVDAPCTHFLRTWHVDVRSWQQRFAATARTPFSYHAAHDLRYAPLPP